MADSTTHEPELKSNISDVRKVRLDTLRGKDDERTNSSVRRILADTSVKRVRVARFNSSI